MGKANRQRRKTHEKARRAARSGSTGARRGASFGPAGGAPPGARRPREAVVEDLVAHAIGAHVRGTPAEAETAIAELLTQWVTDPATAAVVEGILQRVVTMLWQEGWEPADVVRVTGRRLTPRAMRLIADVMTAELAIYPARTVDRRWVAQLAEAEASSWWPRDTGYLHAWLRHGSPDVEQLLSDVVAVMALLTGLPALEPLSDRPGTATNTGAEAEEQAGSSVTVDDRILSRIRALLAKAESTPYPAEAETFTAGAQALMARHSIDVALLAATSPGSRSAPGGRRIGIDNPYESPKVMLLQVVAEANRCRTVWTKDLGHVTVIGYGSDLDAVETLFTSLLVQGTRAMTDAGSRTDRAGNSRTRAFRQSFLSAYAQRLGERLQETTQAQTQQAAAETGRADLLPVLAARGVAVDEAMSGLFPHVVSRSLRLGSDAEGWTRGRTAADLAVLGAGTPLTP